MSSKKVKNNLLAAALVLTVIPPSVKVGQAVIEHCCFVVSSKLLETDDVGGFTFCIYSVVIYGTQMTLTAAHCAKTLILAATSGNLMLRQCTKMLVPALIEYVAKIAPYVIDGSVSEMHATAVAEVWKAFSAIFISVDETQRT
jgi:hypothetical protein